ncbi:MAG: hypothetical protein HZA61_15780 [Candidatus Eisenbacteria bacterium]|uniref:Uncharacterized protein n=1 Tax=Eiseniibacteriota bacterium TaxID=2212470 RepID=A0A933W3B0_UNCEI|nr:hypothetical protein [Candidatus Eisenbacteria bacterium]
MKRLALVTCFVITFAAPSVHAAGVSLSWEDCGAHGFERKSFDCASNTIPGGARMIGSFIPPAGSTAITGEEIVLEFVTWEKSSLPDWWQFKNAGTCRQTALSASADFTAYSACTDYWNGLAAGGITGFFWPLNQSSARARLLIVFAIALVNATPVDEFTEYYAFRLTMTGQKSVGAGACAGCLDPVSILLSEIKLTQPAGVGDFRLQIPASNCIMWQPSSPHASCMYVWDPVRNSTWGAIKAQYR